MEKYKQQLVNRSYTRRDMFLFIVLLAFIIMIPITIISLSTSQNTAMHAYDSRAVEAESGTTDTNVQIVADSTASGGQYAKLFINAVSITPSPTQALVTATPTKAPSPTPISSLPASCSKYPYSRLVNVATTSQLNTAVANALPGDMIVMADGTYAARTTIIVSGTSTNRITLCGTRNAIIAGTNLSGGDVVALKASYWNLSGFKATGNILGIHVVGGNYNDINGLEVYNVGQEAIEVHVYSNHNIIENNYIHDTGKYNAEYGEGVYLGTAQSNWCTYTNCNTDTSNYNQVLNNTFGPTITAENVDVKEGTTGGTISGNTFNGAGEDAAVSFIDSWVDVKGSHYTVANNTGSVSIHYGFEANKQVKGTDSGDYNTFIGNTITLSSTGYDGINIGYNSPVGNVVKCSNIVTNTGIKLTNVTCQN